MMGKGVYIDEVYEKKEEENEDLRENIRKNLMIVRIIEVKEVMMVLEK